MFPRAVQSDAGEACDESARSRPARAAKGSSPSKKPSARGGGAIRPQEIARLAKALSDPTRVRMLMEVRAAGTLNCSQICELFPLSQPTISHHIRTLSDAGLLHVTRQGQYHLLRADDARLGELAKALGPQSTSARPRPRTVRPAAKKPASKQRRAASASE